MNPIAVRLPFGSITRYVIRFDPQYQLGHGTCMGVQQRIAEQLHENQKPTAQVDLIEPHRNEPNAVTAYQNARPDLNPSKFKWRLLTLEDTAAQRRPNPEYAVVVIKDDVQLPYIAPDKRTAAYDYHEDTYTRYLGDRDKTVEDYWKRFETPEKLQMPLKRAFPGAIFQKLWFATRRKALRAIFVDEPPELKRTLARLDQRYCRLAQTEQHLMAYQDREIHQWRYRKITPDGNCEIPG